MESAYEILRDQLNELFSEQKSHEIMIDSLNKQDSARREKEEKDMFNELSVQQWQKTKSL